MKDIEGSMKAISLGTAVSLWEILLSSHPFNSFSRHSSRSYTTVDKTNPGYFI